MERKHGQNDIKDIFTVFYADRLGNVFIGEMKPQNLNVEPNETDAFISKLDSAGNYQWTRQIGTLLYEDIGGISADGLGNAYIAGATYGDLGGINPGPADTDVFLAKYDTNGSLQWTRQLGSPRVEWCHGVSADELGSVFVVGQTNGTLAGPAPPPGTRDGFISKYDAAGNQLWSRQFGPANSTGVSTDSFGNVYVTGDGRGPGTASGPGSAFVTKYEGNGNVLWTRQFAATAPSSMAVTPQGVTADKLGNVFVAGVTYGNLGGPFQGNTDVFLRKYDATGNLQWTRQMLPDGGVGVSADGLGNVYLTGGPTFALPGLPTVAGYDCYLMKFDSAGNMLSIDSYATPNGDVDSSVSADGLGSVYITGHNEGEGDSQYGRPYIVFVAKFSEDGAVPEPAAGGLAIGGVLIGLTCARKKTAGINPAAHGIAESITCHSTGRTRTDAVAAPSHRLRSFACS
jgi:hypothetical protein